MDTLALLTNSAIGPALSSLDQPWTTHPDVPSPQSGQLGAWLDFYGVVRDLEGPDDTTITAIDYEAHPTMAQYQLERHLDAVGKKHGVLAFLVIHRLGVVPVGEASLLVRVCSKHRGATLAACAEFIDALKRDVPIWKHPQFA